MEKPDDIFPGSGTKNFITRLAGDARKRLNGHVPLLLLLTLCKKPWHHHQDLHWLRPCQPRIRAPSPAPSSPQTPPQAAGLTGVPPSLPSLIRLPGLATSVITFTMCKRRRFISLAKTRCAREEQIQCGTSMCVSRTAKRMPGTPCTSLSMEDWI